jgi:hypothetical protein
MTNSSHLHLVSLPPPHLHFSTSFYFGFNPLRVFENVFFVFFQKLVAIV